MAGNFSNSQDLVSIEDIRQDTLILKNGSLCQVLMVGGVNFSLKSEQEQNLLTVAYQNFLNSVDFSMQILIHSRKINIDKYLEDLGKRLADEPSPLLQNQISEYREFIRQFVSENAIMQKMFLVVVPYHPEGLSKSGGGFKLPFFGKKESKSPSKAAQSPDDAKKSDDVLAENMPQLTQRVNQVVRGLSQMGLEAAVLKDEELAELFFNFYNPETVERETLNIPKEEAKK